VEDALGHAPPPPGAAVPHGSALEQPQDDPR
jgi:hypothetical protein